MRILEREESANKSGDNSSSAGLDAHRTAQVGADGDVVRGISTSIGNDAVREGSSALVLKGGPESLLSSQKRRVGDAESVGDG